MFFLSIPYQGKSNWLSCLTCDGKYHKEPSGILSTSVCKGICKGKQCSGICSNRTQGHTLKTTIRKTKLTIRLGTDTQRNIRKPSERLFLQRRSQKVFTKLYGNISKLNEFYEYAHKRHKQSNRHNNMKQIQPQQMYHNVMVGNIKILGVSIYTVYIITNRLATTVHE